MTLCVHSGGPSGPSYKLWACAFTLAVVGVACGSDSSAAPTQPDAGTATPDSGASGEASTTDQQAPGDAADSGRRFDVATQQGVVRGQLEGRSRSFLGIPFAAPPTGANRWRAPQPVTPWSAPRDAAGPVKVCPQITTGGTDVNPASDEDCLTLNVWTPDPPESSPLPVLFWIHGGAFVFGSGANAFYSGSRLVETGKVVVVTINYRLGALGFLADPALTAETADHPTSGNYGFEDQQAALRWVKENIAAFGGNPQNVTIFGESAGGYSVCAHLVAPASAGLFQRAISQSGVCSNLASATREDQYRSGETLAQRAGCTDSSKVLECLRAKTPAELVQASAGSGGALPGGLFFQGSRTSSDAGASSGSLLWTPVVDSNVIPVEPTSDGATLAKVSLILGTNRNEGTLFTAPGLFGGVPVANANEYQAALERSFGAAVSAKVLAEYPTANFPSANDALNEVAGDAFFVCPARRLARKAAAAGIDVYLYSFAHVPAAPLVPNLGSFHAAEIGYVFGTDAPLAIPNAEEEPLVSAIMGYWTRFAKTGDPNGDAAPNWPKYDAQGDSNLKLDLPAPTIESAYKKAKCDFWDGAFP